MSDSILQSEDAAAENELRKILRVAKKIPLTAPPYLATRVTSRLRERRKELLPLRLWRLATITVTLACASSLAFIYFYPNRDGNYFNATLGRPSVVRVEIKDFNSSITDAEIILPEGVFFYSSTHPYIRERRELRFTWNHSSRQKSLPFVVQSEIEGMHTIRVRFLGTSGEVVNERKFIVKFTKADS